MAKDSKAFNFAHVAIIMDGNGRWAQKRSHLRVWGHIRGAQVVSKVVQKASDLGVGELTLYAFSTENWSRPIQEVRTLFKLLDKFLSKEQKRLVENEVSFKVVGDISVLPPETIDLIKNLENKTQHNSGLKLNFAFNYGGRKEIMLALTRIISKGEEISEDTIDKNLDISQVDLLIRTGGEKRISNFLIWQTAYSELYFSDTMWPEFSLEEFELILQDFQKRERRFGGVTKDSCLQKSNIMATKNKRIITASQGV